MKIIKIRTISKTTITFTCQNFVQVFCGDETLNTFQRQDFTE